MSFQISALPKSNFEHLFDLPAEHLAPLHAVLMVADKKPGFPCRVSLADAEIGEEVLLLNYEHQTADTPYRASHAIFVRATAAQASLDPGQVPEMLRSRVLSLRGFTQNGMLVAADLVDGESLEGSLETAFENPSVAYVHLHFAQAGCFAARVDRSASTEML